MATPDGEVVVVPCRIVFVTALGPNHELYGSEKSLLTMAEDIEQTDHWEAAIIGDPRGALQAEACKRGLMFLSEEIREAQLQWPPSGALRVWRRVNGLARIIREVGATIVHANELEACQVSVLAGALAGVPVVIHLRLLYSRKEFLWNLGHRAAAVVAPSCAALRSVGAGGKQRTRVLYDPLDLPAVPGEEDRRRARQKLGIPLDAVVFCIIGRISPAKGQLFFLHALSQVAGECPRAFGVLVGGASQSEEGRRYAEQVAGVAREVGLRGRTLICDYTEEITDFYLASDVSVLPSRSESLGRALTEAMSYGRPTIASNVGGIPEVGEPGRTGLLFELDDLAGLAAQMRRLAADEGLRATMGMAAREWAEKNLTREIHLERMLAVYDQVMRERQ